MDGSVFKGIWNVYFPGDILNMSVALKVSKGHEIIQVVGEELWYDGHNCQQHSYSYHPPPQPLAQTLESRVFK